MAVVLAFWPSFHARIPAGVFFDALSVQRGDCEHGDLVPVRVLMRFEQARSRSARVFAQDVGVVASRGPVRKGTSAAEAMAVARAARPGVRFEALFSWALLLHDRRWGVRSLLMRSLRRSRDSSRPASPASSARPTCPAARGAVMRLMITCKTSAFRRRAQSRVGKHDDPLLEKADKQQMPSSCGWQRPRGRGRGTRRIAASRPRCGARRERDGEVRQGDARRAQTSAAMTSGCHAKEQGKGRGPGGVQKIPAW